MSQSKNFNEFAPVPSTFSITLNRRAYFNSSKLNFYRKVDKPISNFMFSGRGLISRSNCGKLYGFYSCKCGHTKHGKINYCYRLTCPICFHKAITRTAKRITTRLKKIYRCYKKLGYNIKFCHYSFNTLWDIKTNVDLDFYRKKLSDILKSYNFSGVLFFHEYRKDYEKDNSLKYSPHFHMVGTGFLPHYNDFLAEHGFTYTNITRKKTKINLHPPKYMTLKSVYGTVRYLLTHISFKQSKSPINSKASYSHSYHWTNEFTNRSLKKINEVKTSIPLECVKCESMVYLIDFPEYIVLPNDNPYSMDYTYVVTSDYALNYDRYLVKREHKYELKFRKNKGPKNKLNFIGLEKNIEGVG